MPPERGDFAVLSAEGQIDMPTVQHPFVLRERLAVERQVVGRRSRPGQFQVGELAFHPAGAAGAESAREQEDGMVAARDWRGPYTQLGQPIPAFNGELGVPEAGRRRRWGDLGGTLLSCAAGQGTAWDQDQRER